MNDKVMFATERVEARPWEGGWKGICGFRLWLQRGGSGVGPWGWGAGGWDGWGWAGDGLGLGWDGMVGEWMCWWNLGAEGVGLVGCDGTGWKGELMEWDDGVVSMSPGVGCLVMGGVK